MTDSEVQTVFGGALSAQPPPPLHFVVYFRFESDDLADESRQSIPDVLRQIAARSFPDVTVVGHTDTTGDRTANFQLGLGRAMRVRSLLVAAGLDDTLIEVISHGETDLLVPTPDDTSEPRNRRVEIAVR
jgi:outer membrane protein OmpA-like peptidoglycan-associated protein